MNYYDLFSDLKDGHLVLLDGIPGSGKTFLMEKISRDWACNKILKSKLVLFVKLRDLDGKDDIDLLDLLKVACNTFSHEDLIGLSSYIRKKNGRGIVFLFDGFDEYAPGGSDKNYISKLILNQVYSYSTVIVSSRLPATQRFRLDATKWIRVVGFSKREVHQYIYSYFGNDRSSADQLKQCIDHSRDLMSLCFLPLHCAMFVFLYSPKNEIPKTETEFYKRFTLCIIKNHLRNCSKPSCDDFIEIGG